jgi:hypothetical protein
MIERDFDVSFIADLALREKQIQQNYRPIIAVHKWFARRPGTLFRGLLLSEFIDVPLKESFYRAHNLQERFEVIACIGNRGFGVRREDMRKMLLATRGKVFTLKTLDRLVECSRLKELQTRPGC